MAIIPVYNSIILPDTTFYFKKDLLEEMNIHDIKEGEDVVFLIRRDINQKDKEIKEADAGRRILSDWCGWKGVICR